ncbi:uncharacterized protein VTP21DRAFT_6667 [Calcarisporiella thermophila]|uniref:uncharacterized protein n=1 Tax=Calcarisporiella thermophila TaxID=911321 RepID=UPI0037436B03
MKHLHLTDQHHLIFIYLHGFRGSDRTFKDFPSSLANALHQGGVKSGIEWSVYPSYDMENLDAATSKFLQWLNEYDSVIRKKLPETSLAYVICGHSMGGILGAESIIKLREICSPIYVAALIAFDSPFFGLDPNIMNTAWDSANNISRSFTKTFSTISSLVPDVLSKGTATSSSSTSLGLVATTQATAVAAKKSPGVSKWSTIAMGVGAVAALGAAAGAAYVHREKVKTYMDWAMNHLLFIKTLGNEIELKQRIDFLLNTEQEFVFHNFFCELPINITTGPRHFIQLPPSNVIHHFTAVISNAKDPIQGHMSFFSEELTKHTIVFETLIYLFSGSYVL